MPKSIGTEIKKCRLWLIVGAKDTGKTYLTMKTFVAQRLEADPHFSVVVFEQYENESYNEYDLKKINFEKFKNMAEGGYLPETFYYRINIGNVDTNEVMEVCGNYLKYCAIVFDDAGGLFSTGNKLKNKERTFIVTPKNNYCDIFFQYHDFYNIPPEVLRQTDVMAIKRLLTNEKVPKKVPEDDIVNKLLASVKFYNQKKGVKYSTYIVDYKNGQILNMNLDEPRSISFIDFSDRQAEREMQERKNHQQKIIQQTRLYQRANQLKGYN